MVWPREDDDLTKFFRWLTLTHAMRWRVSHQKVGYGPLYQGRFKSFPVKRDEWFLKVCRYVERNALTAKMVNRAEDWQWGSLWVLAHGSKQQNEILSPWPTGEPEDWLARVNEPISQKQQAQWEASLTRCRPFGDEKWMIQTVARLGMEHTIRSEGKPAKQEEKE